MVGIKKKGYKKVIRKYYEKRRKAYKKIIKRVEKRKIQKIKNIAKKIVLKEEKKEIEELKREEGYKEIEKGAKEMGEEKRGWCVLNYYVSGVTETVDKKKKVKSEITLTARIRHFVYIFEDEINNIVVKDIKKIREAVDYAVDKLGVIITKYRVDFIGYNELEYEGEEYYAVRGVLIWEKNYRIYDYSEEFTELLRLRLNL